MTEAAKIMMRKNISSLLVVEKETPVGIISERDFLYILAEERNPLKLTVKNPDRDLRHVSHLVTPWTSVDLSSLQFWQ